MNTKTFWQIIEETHIEHEEDGRDADADRHIEALRTRLQTLSDNEIESFDEKLHHFINHAYSMHLIRAIDDYVGVSGDDGFLYFLAWLVLQGHDLYYQVIRHPSSVRKTFPNWLKDWDDLGIGLCPYQPGAENARYIANEILANRAGLSLTEWSWRNEPEEVRILFGFPPRTTD